jgi:hypothetical protein
MQKTSLFLSDTLLCLPGTQPSPRSSYSYLQADGLNICILKENVVVSLPPPQKLKQATGEMHKELLFFFFLAS